MNRKLIYRCKRCLFPNTKPDLHFDDNGVCMACKFTEYHETIDWKEREKKFTELVERYRVKNNDSYDCLIAVSGGKDSTYQTYMMTEKAGLKPLLVSFEPSYPTEVGKQNLKNLVDTFNCDLIQLKKSPTYRKLAKIAFDVVGDHEWPNHVGIYCWPVRMALLYKIPLIIYGEGRGKIAQGRWETLVHDMELTRSVVEQFSGMNGYRLTDIMEYDRSISTQDVIPYIYPKKEELNAFEIKAYNLGYFFPWDNQINIRLMKQYGWQTADIHTEGTFGNWEDIDCGFMPMHQYFKFIKYGYARATDHASYEIRHGRMTKEQAKELIMEYDWKLPKRYFQEFLEFLGINEDYFYETVDRFANPILFKRNKHGEFMRMWDGNIILEKIWYESFKV